MKKFYYVSQTGESQGPLSLKEMKSEMESLRGIISSETEVCEEGGTAWISLASALKQFNQAEQQVQSKVEYQASSVQETTHGDRSPPTIGALDTSGRVERRSPWAILQFICGGICIIVGFVLLNKSITRIAGGAFFLIGIQAFFVGFLINVFTDIRWFLQESLKVQKDQAGGK
jgi:hypothetical protein